MKQFDWTYKQTGGNCSSTSGKVRIQLCTLTAATIEHPTLTSTVWIKRGSLKYSTGNTTDINRSTLTVSIATGVNVSALELEQSSLNIEKELKFKNSIFKMRFEITVLERRVLMPRVFSHLLFKFFL
uniref:Uncharacterized protein n=1 Tax=Parascaris equorum TaxID=6256 RepID=A0A914RRV2_PAREQ